MRIEDLVHEEVDDVTVRATELPGEGAAILDTAE